MTSFLLRFIENIADIVLTINKNLLAFGSWPLLVTLGETRGAILCRMYDGSPSRPELVAPRSMMLHHDPDGMGGYAAAGRA
jgi:hypothetical protein